MVALLCACPPAPQHFRVGQPGLQVPLDADALDGRTRGTQAPHQLQARVSQVGVGIEGMVKDKGMKAGPPAAAAMG
jgi:hypothetical protein